MDINIGSGLVIPVDVTALPANAQEHVAYIGLRNILMDSHASVTKEDYTKEGVFDSTGYLAAKRAMADKKLAAMLAGDIRAVSIGTVVRGDPVRTEAIEIALDMTIKGAWRKAGKKVDAKAMRAEAIRLVETNPAYRHLAQGRVDKRAEEAKQLAEMLAEADLEAATAPTA